MSSPAPALLADSGDMTHVPKVSVGMPVYNGERYLRQAIDSILSQSFDDFELIVCDNASTDRTEEICRDYAAQDRRVSYYRHAENLGVGRNYNSTFRRARGTYFKWASSNDLCDKSFLSACLAVLEREPDVVLACPLTRYLYPESAVDDEQRLELLEEGACVRFQRFLSQIRLNNVMNGVIRANTLRRTGLHGAFQGSDINLMAELALHGKFKVVPEFLFHRRMEQGSASFLRTHAEMDALFEPKCTKPIAFQSWKEHLNYAAAVHRARLPWYERLCLYRYLLRRLMKDRNDLVADLVNAGRNVFGGRAA